MKKVILTRDNNIAFRYEGKITHEDIFKLLDLDIAVVMENENDDENMKLFVKTGEYQKAKKKEPCINKYTNVPVGYFIIAMDYRINSSGEIVYIKQVKVLSPKSFYSRYSIIEDNEEPSLFEDEKKTEENEIEESNLIKDVTVKEYDDVTQVEIGLNVEEVKNILRENKKRNKKA